MVAKIELEAMTDTELEDLRSRVSEEQYGRKCKEYLPGFQSCDQGSTPHDVHGFDTYGHQGQPLRVTWQKKEN